MKTVKKKIKIKNWNQMNDDSCFDGAINWLEYTLIWLIEF